MTRLGRDTDIKWVQSEKALAPMEITLSGIIIELRLVQLEKAH